MRFAQKICVSRKVCNFLEFYRYSILVNEIERRWRMFVAVVSPDRSYARRLGDDILDACLRRGCYSTFIDYTADDEFLGALREREFGTVILEIQGENEWRIAQTVVAVRPQAKLILLGSNEAAVKGYALNADLCSSVHPKEDELNRIVQIIFPIGKEDAV